ncbi:MAG: hypothetical protein LBR21_03915 [Propionibacteriaceae bacterium]|jgi:major membrane immunogen (membrane-anchored lipoprotein)|nr:hypothetical protein [Propionibacteriaceae bacterium]
MKKIAAAASLLLLTACGYGVDVNIADGGFRDGEFEGKSSVDELGATGHVKLSIASDRLTDVEFQVVDADGTVHDADYGKTAGEIVNQESYEKAQFSVDAEAKYAAQLLETNDLEQVDTISGASLNHKTFEEAVLDALDKARV